MAATSPPPTGAATPTVLAGRYRLERRIATGGMSEVWVATDLVLGRQVAVKLLKSSLAADAVVVERFRREAVAAAKLNHPAIVSVYDTVGDHEREAVVMELVPGRSLRAVLDDRGRLRVDDTLAIGRTVAGALDVAHRAGLVHRDVKPGNILITVDGRVKLTDFGIAKAVEARGDLTADNVMMGTAKYLSPEQVLGRPLDGRADLYSLGLVLYECLAGRVPFVADSDGATAVARLYHEAPPLSEVCPDVPTSVADAIHRLLARNPADRPPTAAATRALLASPGAPAAASERISPTPPSAPRPASVSAPVRSSASPRGGSPSSTRRALGVVAGLVALAVAAVAAFLILRPDPSEGDPSTATTIAAVGTPPPVIGADPAVAPVAIASVQEFDPPPGDGQERPDQVASLTDGNPSTVWSTVCYESPFLYPKSGIGVVLTLSGPAAGQDLVVNWGDGPWGAQVFVADEAGTALADWGSPVARQAGEDPGAATFGLGESSGQAVLLWLTQLSRSPACAENPYQGQIAEISLVPGG